MQKHKKSKVIKIATPRQLIIVTAPDVDTDVLTKLRNEIERWLKDPDYIICTNYNVFIQSIKID
jgi:hypothetical protein